MPCTAIGRRQDGSGVVVVCSVGVDLDLVPYAIDARLAAPTRRATNRAPPGRSGWSRHRCLVPVTAELAALADQPLSLVPSSA